MKLINQSFKIVTMTPDIACLKEVAGRTCYKSEDRTTKDSAIKFVKGLIKSGHTSVLEHGNVTVKIISNRGVTHELVRHCAFSQESAVIFLG